MLLCLHVVLVACAIRSLILLIERVPAYVYSIHDLTDLISDLRSHVVLFIVFCSSFPFNYIFLLLAECDNCELIYYGCIAHYENDTVLIVVRRHGVLASAVQYPTHHQACTYTKHVLWTVITSRRAPPPTCSTKLKHRICGFTISWFERQFPGSSPRHTLEDREWCLTSTGFTLALALALALLLEDTSHH